MFAILVNADAFWDGFPARAAFLIMLGSLLAGIFSAIIDLIVRRMQR